MAEAQTFVPGSEHKQKPVPAVADLGRDRLKARRAAAGSHPSYWNWLLSGSVNGHSNGNGSLNGHSNGNGSLNGHSNGNGSLNGRSSANGSANGRPSKNWSINGHLNGHGSLNGHKSRNGGVPAMEARAAEEMALLGMTPTGLGRRLGRR